MKLLWYLRQNENLENQITKSILLTSYGGAEMIKNSQTGVPQ